MRRMHWLWVLIAAVIFFALGLGLAVGRLLWGDLGNAAAVQQEHQGFFFLRLGFFGGVLLLLLLLEIYYRARRRSQIENRR